VKKGNNMAGTLTRILVVDDYNPWRRFACSALRKRREFQVLEEIADGLMAVQKAQELQPDLILLDIGLPRLNGIEAARRIRQCAPRSKILFVSENRLRDIAQEALATGASGYVVKSEAASELLPAVRAVLEGKQFVSASLATGIRMRPSEKVPDHLQRVYATQVLE
jgi:DNA-binding NarL/FixJ family response regulator